MGWTSNIHVLWVGISIAIVGMSRILGIRIGILTVRWSRGKGLGSPRVLLGWWVGSTSARITTRGARARMGWEHGAMSSLGGWGMMYCGYRTCLSPMHGWNTRPWWGALC